MAILVVLNTHTFGPFHTPAVDAMADKGSGPQHADAICPASWTAPYSYLIFKVARLAVGYVRNAGNWLMKRRGRHSLCRRSTAKTKAKLINNLISVSSICSPTTRRKRAWSVQPSTAKSSMVACNGSISPKHSRRRP